MYWTLEGTAPRITLNKLQTNECVDVQSTSPAVFPEYGAIISIYDQKLAVLHIRLRHSCVHQTAILPGISNTSASVVILV